MEKNNSHLIHNIQEEPDINVRASNTAHLEYVTASNVRHLT